MIPFRALSLSLVTACATASLAQGPAFIPGDLLVMLTPDGSPKDLVHDLGRVSGERSALRVVREVSAPMRTWLLRFDAARIPQAEMLRAAATHREVMLAQNNHIVSDRAVPNDAEYGQQWQHQNINSEGAWDVTTGGVTANGDTIVVAIIEAADLSHPDLAGNAWHNNSEVPGNGVDDDGNGYIDDYRGWDPGTGTDNVYSGPHGTEVAGMIGAKGNNGTQVAGANWNVKMMPVKRNGISEDIVLECYTYPLVMRRLYNSTNGAQGAFVVATNASWGVDGGQPADAPLWCAMYDTLGTAGILNCGATANNAVDVDVVGDLPTACPSDFMISVTATDVNDTRTFSAWGATTIDVGAPGASIFTTQIGGGTGSASGTSFASPLTAGVIGLLYSTPCPSLADLADCDPAGAALHVRQALFSGVDQVGNLPGNTVTGGRINANNSVQWLLQHCGDCTVPTSLTAQATGFGTATLHWCAAASGTVNVRYRVVGAPDWTVVNGVQDGHLDLVDLAICTPYEFAVEAVCDGSVTSGYGEAHLFTSEGCCTAPGGLQTGYIGDDLVNVLWLPVLAGSSYDARISPAGQGNWTIVSGITDTYVAFDNLTACTDYDVQLRTACIGSITDWSPSFTVHTTGCGFCVEGSFCPSVSADASTEWIDRVQIGTIDNQSGNNNGYGLFTDQGTTVIIGQATPITLTPGYSGTAYGEYFTVYVDLDNDGSFTTQGELVYDAGAVTNMPLDGALTVPTGSPQGTTRMRVVMRYNQPVTNGCSTNYDYGETEDYCVTLQVEFGLEEQTTSGLSIHPNPADQQLVLDLEGALSGQPALIEVLDGTGRLVKRATVIAQHATLNTAGLSRGAYVLRVSNGYGDVLHKRFEIAR